MPGIRISNKTRSISISLPTVDCRKRIASSQRRSISGAEALPDYYEAPVNPGDVLGFDPAKGEFADYDEYDPLVRLDPFLLDFDPIEGIFRPGGTLTVNGNKTSNLPDVWDDGDDLHGVLLFVVV